MRLNQTASLSLVPRRSWLLWLGPLPALSAATALAVISGGNLLRGLLLSGALWLLSLPLLYSLEAGLFVIMLFEPLRGFLRRAQFIFVEFTTTDPIHLITPLVTILALAILLWLRRGQLFRQTKLSLPVTILAGVFLLQVFNPWQGSLMVGLSGAMFILIPMAWFYFGQSVKTNFMTTAMQLIVVMGLVCSLHGLYQLFIGYPEFETYWIKHTDHYESIAVGHVTRALATFNSAEEWGRYVQYGSLIAFGFGLGAKHGARRLLWWLASAGLGGMLLITGQRTGIFGLLIGLGTLILIGAESWRKALGRMALMGLAGVLVLVVAKPPSSEDMWQRDSDDKLGTMLSHTARGTLQPGQENSLQDRFRIWTRLTTKVIPANPLGTGLGAGTVAAARFANPEETLYPIDSFIAILIVGCSLPTALLFLWILGRTWLLAIRIFKHALPATPAATVRRIAAAILPMLILNSFFGLTFTIYSAAPIAWLIIGWINAEAARDEQWLETAAV